MSILNFFLKKKTAYSVEGAFPTFRVVVRAHSPEEARVEAQTAFPTLIIRTVEERE